MSDDDGDDDEAVEDDDEDEARRCGGDVELSWRHSLPLLFLLIDISHLPPPTPPPLYLFLSSFLRSVTF